MDGYCRFLGCGGHTKEQPHLTEGISAFEAKNGMYHCRGCSKCIVK